MFRWLGIVLVGTLFLLLSTLVMMTKRPLCIDSSIVNRIDRVSKEGVKTAYSCKDNRVVEFDENLSLLVKEISHKVQPFENVFRNKFTPVRFTLLHGMHDIARIQNNEIFMSDDRLNSNQDFQKILIRSWVRQNIVFTEDQKNLIEDSIVDLIFHIYGPYDFDQKYKRTQSSFLIENYMDLSLKEKKEFSENLISNLNVIKMKSSSEDNIIKVDYIFEISDSQFVKKEDVEKLFSDNKIQNQSIAVVNQKNLWVFGKQTIIPLTSVSQLKSHQYVYVDCEAPDYKKIQDISNISSRLLFVNKCQDIQNLNFQRMYKEGVEGFAKENLSISFMQIYLPSLRQIWIDGKVNPLLQIASGDWKNEFFYKSGWQKPIWDESIQAYRSQSIVQTIDVFRN